ncbi:uncharacterized protein LOC142567959 isoform X2 [Dermacentor variabilis]|uniref:uncharacterized protein LOC142567959 isoform X2 n=1 Tax=Dermacentor variabilis TaxID=34621 RepID=UPI003F5B6814
MENKSTVSKSIKVRYNSPELMRMLLEMQTKRRRQLALQATSTASARPSSETDDPQKSTKTALEICRPLEKLHQGNKNVVAPDTNHNRQPSYMTTSDTPAVYPKPRLVDSEHLCTSTDCDPVEHTKSRRDHTELTLKATSTASARPSSKTGDSQKSTKTPLEIYRPLEKLHQGNKNVVAPDTNHNRQPSYMTTSDTPAVYPKPRLVDSEHLRTSTDCDPVEHPKSRRDHTELALTDAATACAMPSSRAGRPQKSTKPTMAIYRPPGFIRLLGNPRIWRKRSSGPKDSLKISARLAEMLRKQRENVGTLDTDHKQRQPFRTTTSDSQVVYPKPRLVDSWALDTSTNCGPVAHPKPGKDHSEVPNDVPASLALCCASDEPEPIGNRPQLHSGDKQDEDRRHGELIAQAMSEMLRKQRENVGTLDTDHKQRQPFRTTTSDSQVVYPKPRLVDSWALDTSTNCGPVAHPKPGKDHSEVPNDVPASLALCCASDEPEPIGNRPPLHSGDKQDAVRRNGELVAQALTDPASLSSQQLVHLARLVCHTAALTTEHAEPAADFCYKFALVSDSAFLEGLLSGCRELYAKRQELMAPLERSTDVAVRWMPYVSFLAQLLVAFVSSNGDGATAARDTVKTRDGKRSNVISKNTVRSLAILLHCCFHNMLCPPSLDSFDQMECLKSALTAAGKAMEKAEPHLMQAVMRELRDAYYNPETSEHSRKVLLELIELHASGWQLKPSTQ